jgi:hypothetical protein
VLLKHDATTTVKWEEIESDGHPRYVDAYTITAESLVGCTPSYEQDLAEIIHPV